MYITFVISFAFAISVSYLDTADIHYYQFKASVNMSRPSMSNFFHIVDHTHIYVHLCEVLIITPTVKVCIIQVVILHTVYAGLNTEHV